MSDLDEKLREILMDCQLDEDPKMLQEDYILLIKQAFKDHV